MGDVTSLGPRRSAPNLQTAVARAIRQMHWLTTSDDAMVALAKFYAKQIEESDHPERAAETIGLRLENCLKSLGGTPLQRKQIVGEATQVKNRLHELRAKRQEGA